MCVILLACTNSCNLLEVKAGPLSDIMTSGNPHVLQMYYATSKLLMPKKSMNNMCINCNPLQVGIHNDKHCFALDSSVVIHMYAVHLGPLPYACLYDPSELYTSCHRDIDGIVI